MTAPSIRLRRPSTPAEHGQWVLLALLALLTVSAWALTVYQAQTMDMPMGVVAPLETVGGTAQPPAATDGMGGMAMGEPAASGMGEATAAGMAGMAAGAWTWHGFAAFVVAWAVMMAAMMFPAAAPMLLLFRRVSAQRGAAGGALVPTWLFAAGYLLVWASVGVGAWFLVRLGSDVAGRLGAADRRTWAPLALGATLIVAGLYQFSPLKGVCLRHCQSPVGFVMTRWRNGRLGALRMGAVHGAYCLGCCWALFSVLVAAGVMSLAWMLLLTLVVFAEKAFPFGRRASLAVGVALLLLGIVVASGTTAMPWTT